MTRTDEFQLLKTLDAANADGGIDPHGPRARADLQRILATDPAGPGLQPRPASTRKSTRAKRAIGLGALVATASAAAVVLPSALGGDEAFATWTASPAGMSAKDRASASASCRDEQKSGSPDYRADLSTASTAISERRGAWTLVILAGQDGFSALCITDDSTRLFRDFIGSIGKTPQADQPAKKGLAATVLGTGSTGGGELSIVAGPAGSEVVAVSYNSARQGRVLATVSGGQFALWLPGNELENASKQGVPLQVTYRDGTSSTVTLTL
ncbi:hypothetical protein [Kribbella deserti]|uniref:Anti-sigma factor n=1 Tax=Kribbella deserti TaxID=1926257 RepID=A0ABV6QVR1_9ACTN